MELDPADQDLEGLVNDRRFDIAIVGGGPAGAAAALALRAHDPRRSVVVIEASTHETERVGETLHPSARPLLERLGVLDAFVAQRHREAAGTVSAWGGAALGGDDFITSVFGRGFHLDRCRFDAMLIEKAESRGAIVWMGTRLASIDRTGAGFQLDLRDVAGEPDQVEASFVIDATGRRARIANRFGARRILFDHLVGAFVFFDVDDGSFRDTRTLVEAVEEGWCYSARLPGSGAVAALMTDGDIAGRLRLREPEAWCAALAAAPHTRKRLASARARGAPEIHPAGSGALDRAVGEGWIAVGDAALSLDPLSGQGIIKALHHGVLAAYAASDHLAGKPGVLERYGARVEAEIDGYLEARETHYRREQRFPGSSFWRRRQPQLQISPTARLAADEGAAGMASSLPMHLASADLEHLASLCEGGLVAHEVVAAFRRGRAVGSDRRIILALQYLVDESVVRLAQAG